MSSSPVCTCGVCPAHGPAGQDAEHPGGGAGWAGPVRRYLESVVEWLDGPEAIRRISDIFASSPMASV